MLNYSDVTAILTINEYQNFSKAAQILHIGQPALSKKIRAVEKNLGYEIFVRSQGQGAVKPSAQGLALLPILEKIRQLNSQALDIQTAGRQLYIRLASSDGPFIAVLDAVIEAMLREQAQVVFKLKNFSYAQCVDALANETIDIAFIGTNIYRRNIHIFPLYEEDMVFVCKAGGTAGTSVTTRTTITTIDPATLDYARGIYSPYSAEFSVWMQSLFSNQRPLVHCDLNSQIKHYIDALDLWSIVPHSVAHWIAQDTAVTILPLSPAPPRRVIYCAVRSGAHHPATDTFLARVRAALGGQKTMALLA